MAWTIRYEGLDPAQEGLHEALCAVGNGYFVTLAAPPEAVADGVHYPGTYLAGCHHRASSTVLGRTVVNEDLVNCCHDQFADYERLEELDWAELRRRHGDIRRLDRLLEADGDSVNRYRA